MRISGLTGGHTKQPVVVLVNCAGGDELAVVHDTLSRSLNTPAVLIGQADLTAVSISLDLSSGLLGIDGAWVRPAVLWARHSSAGAIAAQGQRTGRPGSLDAAAWARFLDHVAASAPAALPGSTPAAHGQLTDAEALGVRTPRTVVTTDVTAGIRQVGSSRVIVKTPDFRVFEPDQRNWAACWPAVVGAGSRDGRQGAGHPVVVQEYVPHERELRVYYLNGGICAFEVDKPDPSSPWTDPGSVTVTRADCPGAAAAAVRTLCAAWDLRYGAFDLLLSSTGEPVFLEVNRDGDWLWFERKARWHGVSFMAAVMVRELFVRVTS
jgi:hypothetical protein